MSDEPNEKLKAYLKLIREPSGSIVEEEPSEPTLADLYAPTLEDIKSLDDDGRSDVKNEILRRIGIIDAYERYSGKTKIKPGTKKVEIKVRCPNPNHEDAHPSSWFNTEKQTGNCTTCGGYDIFDLYAWHSGRKVPQYRTHDFGVMIDEMATDLGIQVRRVSGTSYVAEVDPEVEPAPPTSVPEPQPAEPDEPQDNVFHLGVDEDEDDDYSASPPILWREILNERSTFLSDWMEACSQDDLPEEFYFWLGLQAIAAALGNDVRLKDYLPVRSNLMVCLVGPSGLGKSRSTTPQRRLLRAAFPWDPDLGGVKFMLEPASGEALIKEFNQPLIDPSTGATLGWTQVRGMIRVDELATFVDRAGRSGNTVKSFVMQLFDSDEEVGSVSISGGSNVCHDHFMQMTATTQARSVRHLLTDKDAMSGFINRWVFVTGKQKKLRSWGGEEIDVDPLVPKIMAIRHWGATKRIDLDRDAQAIWGSFFTAHIEPLKLDDSMATFGRIDLLFKKLMLIFAADQKKAVVDAVIMNQVLSLWSYLKFSYGYIDKQTEVPVFVQDSREAEMLVLKLARLHKKQTGKDPTFRDIYVRMSAKKRSASTRKTYVDALNTLKSTGEVEEYLDKKGGAGRPTMRYAIVES